MATRTRNDTGPRKPGRDRDSGRECPESLPYIGMARPRPVERTMHTKHGPIDAALISLETATVTDRGGGSIQRGRPYLSVGDPRTSGLKVVIRTQSTLGWPVS